MDAIGFDPTNRTLARTAPWPTLVLGLGWAVTIAAAALIAFAVST